MDKLPITVVVATRNEALNIRKCLESLTPAEKVVVVDSNSSDGTRQIAEGLGADVYDFQYTGAYPKKRQWMLDSGEIMTPWVFLVDADEEVPEELWREVAGAISRADAADAFLITKSFHFLGKRLRFGGFSFSAVLLFRNGAARFEKTLAESASTLDMEVHERVIVQGSIARLRSPLVHNDFKGLQAYIERHNKYSTWEAELRSKFLSDHSFGEDEITPRWFGNSQEIRRAMKGLVIRFPFEPALWWTYHTVLRLGLLEGRRGLIAAQIRANYIREVRAKLYERELLANKVSRRNPDL